MKVAFWSNEYEKSYTFLNFIAVSIASVMCSPYTVALMENYIGKENLSKAFFSSLDNLYTGYGSVGFYEGKGIEGLLRRIYRGERCPGLLRSYAREVIPRHLYYIPQGRVINSELFDYELHHNIKELFSIIEMNTDLCYINTSQQNHLSSKEILQNADLIVINLYQNPKYLDEFFKNYRSLISKSIFIVGGYSPKSVMSCKRISRLYKIPIEDISPIPYNDYFHVACNCGSAKEFINSNYFCSKDSSHYLFIQGVMRAAIIIARRIEKSILLKNKEMKKCGV